MTLGKLPIPFPSASSAGRIGVEFSVYRIIERDGVWNIIGLGKFGRKKVRPWWREATATV